MSIFLFFCSVISFLLGCIVFAAAKGSMHEGLILYLISVSFFCSMAIVSAINRLSKIIKASQEVLPAIPAAEHNVPFPPRPPDFVPESPPATPNVTPELPAVQSMPVQSWVEEAKAELKRGKT